MVGAKTVVAQRVVDRFKRRHRASTDCASSWAPIRSPDHHGRSRAPCRRRPGVRHNNPRRTARQRPPRPSRWGTQPPYGRSSKSGWSTPRPEAALRRPSTKLVGRQRVSSSPLSATFASSTSRPATSTSSTGAWRRAKGVLGPSSQQVSADSMPCCRPHSARRCGGIGWTGTRPSGPSRRSWARPPFASHIRRGLSPPHPCPGGQRQVGDACRARTADWGPTR
jgi:hypothetical protein